MSVEGDLLPQKKMLAQQAFCSKGIGEKPYLSIVDTNAADNTPRPDKIKRRPQRRTKTNNLNNQIRPTTLRHLQNSLLHALGISLEVQWLSAQLLSDLQPAINSVDGEEVLRLILQSSDDGAEPDGPATDHNGGDVILLLHGEELPGGLGAEEARGEDVGHEDEGLVGDGAGGFDDGAVGEGDADIFGLAAVEGTATEEDALFAAGGEAISTIEAL